jgi:hypothetical protein
VSRVVASPHFNAVVGIVGLLTPLAAWVLGRESVRNILFGIETFLLVLIVTRHAWLQRSYIQLRRASSKEMSDSRFFERIRSKLEEELSEDMEEVADGHLNLYASEVPRISVLLFRTLIESDCEPRRVTATDLTTDPRLLTRRREYLAVNRKLIESGGSILRIYICRISDLTSQDFATDLLALADLHRSLGVQCGLRVRDWLSAEYAVDFVVVSLAAVLVEEVQGDAEYVSGRSSVHFKQVEKWSSKFYRLWETHDSPAAPFLWNSYEMFVRRMLVNGYWFPTRIRAMLENPTTYTMESD